MSCAKVTSLSSPKGKKLNKTLKSLTRLSVATILSMGSPRVSTSRLAEIAAPDVRKFLVKEAGSRSPRVSSFRLAEISPQDVLTFSVNTQEACVSNRVEWAVGATSFLGCLSFPATTAKLHISSGCSHYGTSCRCVTSP